MKIPTWFDPFGPQAVEWDLLLVTCGSGRLFVWGLGRGTLERVVEGALTPDLVP